MPLVLEPPAPGELEKLMCGDPAYEHLNVWEHGSWRVYLNVNQTHLFRCYAWLIGDHVDLQQRPALDPYVQLQLQQVSRSIHAALGRLSKPDMVNELYAGNEYEVHRGHAHLHFIPRYHEPPSFAGMVFPDSRFGQMYDSSQKLELPRSMTDEMRAAFATELTKAGSQ